MLRDIIVYSVSFTIAFWLFYLSGVLFLAIVESMKGPKENKEKENKEKENKE